MTPDQRIERSRRPFETADADEVVDLFTPGAFCQSSVFCEPYVGSDAIRQYWQGGAGTQRAVTVRMERPVIIDARVAAEWRTTMTNPDEGEITQPGCLLLALPPTGAARTCGNTGRSSPAGKTRPTAFLPGDRGLMRHAPCWPGGQVADPVRAADPLRHHLRRA